MRTHVKTLIAVLACASVALGAAPTAYARSTNTAPLLPGDVRVWEQTQSTNAQPVLHHVAVAAKLPGDIRVQELRSSTRVNNTSPVVASRVVNVHDHTIAHL